MTARLSALVERSAPVGRAIATSTIVQIVAVMWVHSILFARLFRHGQLDPAAYAEPVLVVEAAKDRGLVIITLVPVLVLFLARRYSRWQDLDPMRRARWLVWVIAGVFAWAYSTHDVNLYYDQSHALDRVLLVALWIGLFFHPIAVVPFVALLVVIVTQQHHPLPEGDWTWPDKRLPLDILLSFTSYLLVAAVVRERIKPFVLPLALLCVTGTMYGHAAVNKALLGPDPWWWIANNDLGNLMVSAHVNGGFLRELGQDNVIAIANVLHAVKLPLAIVTFLVELSGFALVVRWKLTRLLLPGFMAFHVGVVVSSGIFFWKWMVVDAMLLWYLAKLHRDARERADDRAAQRVALFTPRITALALAVMIGARFHFVLVPFAWFDSRLVNYFEIYGVADSGRRYRLDARFFAPYDVHVQQSRHYQLLDDTVLVGTYGVTEDWRVAHALDDARPDELGALHQRFGQRWHRPDVAAVYVEFFRRYVVNAQRRGGRRSFASWLAPPYHFRTTAPDDRYEFQEPLASVAIEFREYFYDGDRIVATRHVPVATIPLTPAR